MNESDGDKRGRRRQWAVVIAIVLAPLLLIAWLILFWDIEPPDESAALPLRPLTVRSENEPLAVFVRDWSAAADAFGDEWSAAVRTESPLFTGEAGVEKELAVVYERHHKLADAFLRLADEDAPLLWLGVDDQIDMGMTLSEVKELQNSAKAALLCIRHMANEGQLEKAAEGAIRFLKLSDALLKGEGTLIHWLVAITIRRQALEAVYWVLKATPPEEQLGSLQQALVKTLPESVDLGTTLRIEHMALRNTLKVATVNELIGGTGSPIPLTLKVNLTRHELAEERAPLYEGVERDWTEAQEEAKRFHRQLESNAAHPWKRRFHLNAVGRMVMDLSSPVVLTIVDKSVETLALQRCLLAAVALRAAELATGKMPDDLHGLAVDIPSEVLIDPFVGAPLMWLPSDGKIYSVGEDGLNDGGLIKEPIGRERNGDVGLIYPGFRSEENP